MFLVPMDKREQLVKLDHLVNLVLKVSKESLAPGARLVLQVLKEIEAIQVFQEQKENLVKKVFED